MINTDHIFGKSIFAGIVIGISGYIYLTVPNHILGSLLFSLGLYTCVLTKSPLFTGKSGFINDSKDARRLVLVLILNLISAFTFGLVVSLTDCSLVTSADNLVQSRIDTPILPFIIRSFITGFLMTLAISSDKNSTNNLVLFLCVLAFISSGCYHCIADTFYYGVSSLTLENLSTILFRLFIVILFNFLGCNLYNLIVEKSFIYKKVS